MLIQRLQWSGALIQTSRYTVLIDPIIKARTLHFLDPPRVLNIESTSLVLWLLPTIILVPVMIGFVIQYDRKYNKKPKPSAHEARKL